MFGRLMQWIYRVCFGLHVEAGQQTPIDELDELEAERETLLAAYSRIDRLLLINRRRIDDLITRRIENWQASS